MQTLLDKRRSLHRRVQDHEKTNTELQSQVEQMQGLANLGMVAAMIAHEMNNILTPLANYARLSLDNLHDTELITKTLHKTVANSDRAAKILESMLGIAGSAGHEKTACNLAEIIDEAFACIGRDFAKDNIKISINVAGDLSLYAEAAIVQQVMMNLILNARYALLQGSPADRRLTISAVVTPDWVRIRVTDNGCGIESHNLAKIFKPFFTTRMETANAQRPGAGLGLAFCKRIIDAHNGLISVESTLDRGTTFEICLPTETVGDKIATDG